MGIACLQNAIGSVKDALGGALRKGLALAPGLNVPATEFGARKSQRFAAKERHGFGFHLADIARGHFGIGQVGFVAMTEQLVTEQLVTELVEKPTTAIRERTTDIRGANTSRSPGFRNYSS